jgi:septal ring factor EnvC (AmiA/AmiB activator)
MTDQEKELRTPENETEEAEDRQDDQLEKFKETTEKIWGSTRQAFNTATFKANQYKKLVQKKIDLSALHKKIGAAHAELGKLIDDLREAGKKSIMAQEAVKTILNGLDELKAEAAALEEEIEQIRTEESAQEAVEPEEKSA